MAGISSRKVPIEVWVGLASLSLCLVFVWRQFFILTFKIPSGSMAPAIEAGDYILVNRLCRAVRDSAGKVRRGQVIVYRGRCTPSDENINCVKRVVGLPGETIAGFDGRIRINGELLAESYSYSEHPFDEVKLGDNQFFLMGDNRANSFDSRYVGPIKQEQFLGCAEYIYWSWNEIKGQDGQTKRSVRYERIGRIIE